MPDKTLKCKDCKKDFVFPEKEQKFFESKGFKQPKRCKACRDKRKGLKAPEPVESSEEDWTPDWDHECEVCGQKPVHRITGMCGPCTFGTADAIGGNW